MKINYQLTKNELAELIIPFINSSTYSIFTIGLMILSAPLIILIIDKSKNNIFHSSLVFNILKIILVMYIVYLILKKIISSDFKRTLKNIYSNSSYKYLFSSVTIEITKENIKYINEYMEEIISISSIISIYEINNFFIIKTTCKNDLFIPVNSINDKELFVNLITNKGSLKIKNNV